MADQQQQSPQSNAADSSALTTSSSQPATVATVRRKGRPPAKQKTFDATPAPGNPFGGLTNQLAEGIVGAEMDELVELPSLVDQVRARRAPELQQIMTVSFNRIAAGSSLALMASMFADPGQGGGQGEEPVQ